jgi:beta-1,4-mannosyl-glycoprotein beta-1,4-N-acetylglucosaminyltransferase
MKIIDCFPFFNELDLLEIRLNSLAPYVDRFVLTEMPVTHSGNPKPLYFEENKERYKDFPITHIIVEDDKNYVIEKGKYSGNAWRLEHYQRECLMQGLTGCDPEDIILLSDLDEIPNLIEWNGNEGAFKQKLYYYYLNCFTNTGLWKGTQAYKYKNIKTLTHVRNHRNSNPTVLINGGWHFSTIGSADQIRYKIESFAHTELDTDYFKENLEENIKNLKDPYERAPAGWDSYPEYKFTIEMPNGPQWLLDNKERYPDLFYAEK